MWWDAYMKIKGVKGRYVADATGDTGQQSYKGVGFAALL